MKKGFCHFYLCVALFLCGSNSTYCFNNPEDSIRSMLKPLMEDTARIKVYNDLSKCFERNEMEKSIAYADTAIYLSEKINYQKGLGIAYLHKGIALRYLGEFDLALELNQKALNVFTEIKDLNLISGTHINIGVLFWMTDNLEQAKEHYLLAKEPLIALKNYSGLGSLYTNLGILACIDTNYVEGETFFFLSLENYRLANDKNGEARALDNLGSLFLELGNFSKAVEYNQACFEIYSELNDPYGMAKCLDVRSNILSEKGDYTGALKALDEAWAIADDKKFIDVQTGIADSRFQIYQLLGDFKKALFYYKEKEGFEDTLAERASEEKLQELEAKYENDKQAKEIELLNKDKTLQDLRITEQKAIIAKDNLFKNALIGGLILILIVAGIAIYSFITKRRDNRIIQNQKQEVEEQHHKLSEVHKEIKDSINYAEKIQRALLVTDDEWKLIGKEHMILFKPKDVVSGDFYWAYHDKQTGRSIWVVADCTGHGVPGAFMSMLGISLLNEIIIDSGRKEPSDILDTLRNKIMKALEQKGENTKRRDGMDMTICIWDKNTNILSYAGANNPIWIVSKRDVLLSDVSPIASQASAYYLHELKPDKQPVGFHTGILKPFSQIDVKLSDGDLIYSFTDGFADQFGGTRGKKFKYLKLKETLLELSNQPLGTQSGTLSDMLDNWRGTLEQVDDVCGIGICI